MARSVASVTGDELLKQILKQIKTTNRLLAVQLKADFSQMELIGLLDDIGLTAKEVGEILGTSAATVAVTQQRLRDKKKKKPKE